MRIILTEHAEKRCKQQDIEQQTLHSLVSRLPKAKSSFRWNTIDGVAIIYRDIKNTRLIITVIGTNKQWKRFLYKQRKITRRLG